MNLDWMAWTWPTAFFFIGIAATLVGMTVLEIRFPTVARMGVLGLRTTRGDRLFISLLGSAFIHLAWLGWVGGEALWGASLLCLVYAACIFKWA